MGLFSRNSQCLLLLCQWCCVMWWKVYICVYNLSQFWLGDLLSYYLVSHFLDVKKMCVWARWLTETFFTLQWTLVMCWSCLAPSLVLLTKASIMVDTVPLVFLSSGVIHLLHLLPRELTNRALNIQVNSSIKAFLRHMVRISPAVFFRLQLSGWDQCTICCCTAITPGIKWLLCPTRTLGTLLCGDMNSGLLFA
jgi:hypothetical protein